MIQSDIQPEHSPFRRHLREGEELLWTIRPGYIASVYRSPLYIVALLGVSASIMSLIHYQTWSLADTKSAGGLIVAGIVLSLILSSSNWWHTCYGLTGQRIFLRTLFLRNTTGSNNVAILDLELDEIAKITVISKLPSPPRASVGLWRRVPGGLTLYKTDSHGRKWLLDLQAVKNPFEVQQDIEDAMANDKSLLSNPQAQSARDLLKQNHARLDSRNENRRGISIFFAYLVIFFALIAVILSIVSKNFGLAFIHQ